MDQSQKKVLLVKIKAVARTLKQYKNYKQEVQAFDLNAVSQDKKKGQFYKESQLALQTVKKNLIDWVLQLDNFMNQNKQGIDQISDAALVTEIQKAKQNVQQARSLFPADL